jgi:hypothetical protein
MVSTGSNKCVDAEENYYVSNVSKNSGMAFKSLNLHKKNLFFFSRL